MSIGGPTNELSNEAGLGITTASTALLSGMRHSSKSDEISTSVTLLTVGWVTMNRTWIHDKTSSSV